MFTKKDVESRGAEFREIVADYRQTLARNGEMTPAARLESSLSLASQYNRDPLTRLEISEAAVRDVFFELVYTSAMCVTGKENPAESEMERATREVRAVVAESFGEDVVTLATSTAQSWGVRKVAASFGPRTRFMNSAKVAPPKGVSVRLNFYREILPPLVSEVQSELQKITAERIDVYINSGGGDYFSGVAIYNALRSHPAYVTVYVEGIAASAASLIAISGDHVIMRRGAQIMIHDVGSIINGGNAAELETEALLIDKLSNEAAAIYAARAGGSANMWRTLMQRETWYSAQEAVDVGLADAIG